MTTDLSQDTLCECLLEGWKDEHTLRHKLLLSMKLRMDYSKSGKFRRSRLSGQKRFIELFFYSKNKTLYSLQHDWKLSWMFYCCLWDGQMYTCINRLGYHLMLFCQDKNINRDTQNSFVLMFWNMVWLKYSMDCNTYFRWWHTVSQMYITGCHTC